jgi:hypothetical protein
MPACITYASLALIRAGPFPQQQPICSQCEDLPECLQEHKVYDQYCQKEIAARLQLWDLADVVGADDAGSHSQRTGSRFEGVIVLRSGPWCRVRNVL